MAEALVSAVLRQLGTTAMQEIGLVMGVEEDIRQLTNKFQAIQVVLVDAENKQLKDRQVRGWLDKLKNVAYDMEDVLDEWNALILKRQSITWKNKVCSFFTSLCDCFGILSSRHDIAQKIKTLKKKLDELVAEKQLYNFSETTNVVDATISLQEKRSTTSFIDVSEIEGRDEEKSTLVKKLLSGSSEGGKDLHVISLVGLGGIGKTTLAKFAYNHDEIVNGFEKRGWVCVSESVDKIRIAKTIIQQLKKDRPSGSTELEPLLQEIVGEIKEKKFLLVLDDVWTENPDDLKDLFLCLQKSRARCTVLMTTRNDRVAFKFRSDIIPVKELSEDKCWSLFSRLAFFEKSAHDREKFREIGRKIVAKCKGLPLAAKALGTLLCSKEHIEEWESILESEIWKLEFDKGPLQQEFHNGPLSSLLLSYNYLPYMVKSCFLYCAVFPKDYYMYKDELIQLWMAQGYLASERNQALEMTGNWYFNILASRSFFQEFERDAYGNVLSCKMHDIVHDLAQYLTQNECLTIEVNGDEVQWSYENARHAMIVLGNKASLPISYINSKTLRSLLVDYNHTPIPKIMNIDQLKCLRALKLVIYYESDPDTLKKIPNLIQLRYLNVFYNKYIKELPEELCELYNLQTLNVSSCIYLEKLPRGIKKLINLRHLINLNSKSDTHSLSYMPKGIEELTHLRTLNEFVVSDSNHAEEASSLKSLKYLKHLQGSLRIRMLGNMRDVSEAKEAELHNKTKLTVLYLWFDASGGEESTRTAEDDERLLEALQPLPPNLQRLFIAAYRGKYISQIWLTPLIRELHFYYCDNLEYLPPLGKFSSLELLRFFSAKRVKKVSREFLGIESGILTSTSTASSITVFPKLTSLKFSFMSEWEEWDYGITGKDENIQIMPSLGSLKIRYCPKLKALPDHLFLNASLKKLEIYECPLLYSYLKKRGQQWPLNFHIPEISYEGRTEDNSYCNEYKSVIDPEEHKFELECLDPCTEVVVRDINHAEEASSLAGLKHLKHLQGRLRIRGLGNVRDVSEAKEAELHNKTKLHVLYLDFDASDREEESARTAEDDEQLLEALQPLPPNLQRLFITYYRGKYISQIWLTPLIQLRFLWINNCENLEYLPPLGKLPSLESLHFSNARMVKNVSTEFLGIESGIPTSLSPASSITVFPKLTCLEFYGMPEWEEWDYGITGKDENIQIMPSLVSLTINGCHKLKALPDHLFLNASLKELDISDCPLLYSYLKKRGQQWPLNFHIPEISYEGRTEDDSVCNYYKSIVDPKEHKFEFEIKETTDTVEDPDPEEEQGRNQEFFSGWAVKFFRCLRP